MYGRGGNLGYVTQMPRTFVPSIHGGSTQTYALIGQIVSEEKMFEHCERRTEDGRRSMGIL